MELNNDPAIKVWSRMPICRWCHAAYALETDAPCHYCARALALADTIAYDGEGAVVAPEGDTHD